MGHVREGKRYRWQGVFMQESIGAIRWPSSTFPAAAIAPPNGGAREVRRPNIPGLTNGPDHSRTIRHDTKVRISRPHIGIN